MRDVTCQMGWMTVMEPKGKKCKHGEHKCRKCGIDNWKTATATHVTVNGIGVIGRLRDKKTNWSKSRPLTMLEILDGAGITQEDIDAVDKIIPGTKAKIAAARARKKKKSCRRK